MAVPRPLAVVFVVAVGAALALAGVALAVRPSGPDAVLVPLADTPAPEPADGQYKIYIAGAVQRPGVYAFRPGDRVADAVETAGGPTDDADILAVNLARRLHDEDHIVVPRRGESVGGASGGATQRLDINSATAAALEELPGIGPARAQRIVESRTRDGRFAEPADLVKRKLLPQSVLDGIKDLIDVRP